MPELRPFQREDVRKIKKARLRALIASAPGTGKSAVSLRAIYEKHSITFPCLILCPASVTENWAREIEMWAPGIPVVIIDDMNSKIPRLRSKHVFYIMNWALLDPRQRELRKLKFQSVIADEVHYVKAIDSLRSKAFKRTVEKIPYKIFLSGTPIVNTEGELGVIKRYLGVEKPLMIRRFLEEVAPDVPRKKRSYLDIHLRDAHQRIYDKANKEFEDWLRNETQALLGAGKTEDEIERILSAEALVKIGYLRRLVGEFKVPAAVDWISRAVRVGEPIVVFVEHQRPLTKIRKALKKLRIRHAVIQGSTTPKKRQEAIDLFQTGQVPVFIGTKAAKEGITLTRARHLLFVERFYTSADEEQAEDRIRRISQTRKTTMWYLHARNTIDDRLDEIVKAKRKIVANAIGSIEIEENENKAVESIIHNWNHAVGRQGKVRNLGRSKPLPPLPKPRFTYAIIFGRKRWDERTAQAWCRMHGYSPRAIKKLPDRIKIEQLNIQYFQPNQFGSFAVCRDIKIITGRRMKHVL